MARVPEASATQCGRITRQGTTPPPSAPEFTNITVSGTNIVFRFTGSTNDSPGSFSLFSAATINGSYSLKPTAAFTQISPGVFQASIAASGPTQFYRIRK